MKRIDDNKTYGLFCTTQGRILEAQFESAGATVITFPARECKRIDLLESGLGNLDAVDWIIFTDILAARYFIEILAAIDVEISELEALRICAVGENVVLYLRSFHIHSDLILAPRDNQIADSISEFAGDELNCLRFLIPTDSDVENTIGMKLKSKGAVVQMLPVYRATSGDDADNARTKALILGGAVDEMVFSSMDDLFNLQFLFPDEQPSELLNEVGVLTADEDVFNRLAEYGLHPRYF